MTVFFMDSPVYAQNNLDKAKTALEGLQAELVDKIIPVAAAVILLGSAICYAERYIGKDTFVR
ncbi:TrbC/VirB2 family protein [Bartonella gliris]|uniref:TrbC/VirB2 family protein n=1 Tax=Bartonella gliris TaxID=3004109 RepID=UPI0037BF3679